MIEAPWAGRLLLVPGAAVYVGPLGPTTTHTHVATQLVIAPTGIDLAWEGQPSRRVITHWIAPNQPHALGSVCPRGAVILLDTRHGRSARWSSLLPAGPSTSWSALDEQVLLAAVARPLDASWLDALATAWSAPPAPRPPAHPGVQRVLAAIDARLADGAIGTLDAASLSAVAGLSVGRLGHAFRSQVGLPVRPYVKWRRLERAAHALGEGRSIAAAAHETGFADAAHFSRTFRAMTGLSPSTLVGKVAWITRAR